MVLNSCLFVALNGCLFVVLNGCLFVALYCCLFVVLNGCPLASSSITVFWKALVFSVAFLVNRGWPIF